MMSVFVDKRRLEGARNRHEYIALQRRNGPRTQVKKRIEVPRTCDSAENIVLGSEHSTILETRDTRYPPTRKTTDAQASADHAAVPQSPSGVASTQTWLLTAEQAHPSGLTEGTRDDVVQIQSGVSTVMKRDEQDQLSIVSTASPKNNHAPLETKNAMRDHTASDDCLAETPSTALVLRNPTGLLSTNDTSQDPKTSANPQTVQNQGQQAGAAFGKVQKTSDQIPIVNKSSQTTQTLFGRGKKTSEDREARSQIQGGFLTRASAPPHRNGSPLQQDIICNDDKPVDHVGNAESDHHEQTEHVDNVKNAALIALGKKVEQAHILKTRCEEFKRKTMGLQAQSQAKQTALTESINRANEDIKRFNERNMRHQKLQAQVSDSEAELAKARRQTTLSQDEARRKEIECQDHAASLAKLADDHTSANREYENEVRSLGFG